MGATGLHGRHPPRVAHAVLSRWKLQERPAPRVRSWFALSGICCVFSGGSLCQACCCLGTCTSEGIREWWQFMPLRSCGECDAGRGLPPRKHWWHCLSTHMLHLRAPALPVHTFHTCAHLPHLHAPTTCTLAHICPTCTHTCTLFTPARPACTYHTCAHLQTPVHTCRNCTRATLEHCSRGCNGVTSTTPAHCSDIVAGAEA